jgi:N-acetylneuraminic acid mutarotase
MRLCSSRGTAVLSICLVVACSANTGSPGQEKNESTAQSFSRADLEQFPTAASFFARPWSAAFDEDGDGNLVWRAPANAQPGRDNGTVASHKRRLLESKFPAVASGQVEVRAGDDAGEWIRETFGAASSSRAYVANGRIFYPSAKPGIDRVYQVSGDRVEEFLRISNPTSARDLFYVVETGPGIADLRADGSGLALTDVHGSTVMKSPMPEGVDSRGRHVRGTLHTEQQSKHVFTVRVRLNLEPELQFPVLLDPSWVATGALSKMRLHHTATLLQSGKVLVAGYWAESELYDVGSGTWSSTGALPMASRNYTATLLPSGKVLFVGGDAWTGSTYVYVPAQLYDPDTGTFSPSSPIGTNRSHHTATLLSNGKVLIVGGYRDDYLPNYPAPELYDPPTNSWSTVALPKFKRGHHSATLLSDGRVLVAGGANDIGVTLSSAEIYDPSTGSWTTTGSMGTPHEGHTASVLPNGKVLVASGEPTMSAELFNPTTGTWSAASGLGTARERHTANLLPMGKVLVTGGMPSFTATAISTAELYDPQTNTWVFTSPMSVTRHSHTATLLQNGKLLVVGGYGANYLSSAEIYDHGLNAAANGQPCSSSANCASDFCVDGVCCDTPCGKGVSDDCQACSTATGAPTDGTCALLTGTACAADSNICTADTCSAGSCVHPFLAAGQPCGTCRKCDGSGTCSLSAAGTPCSDGQQCTSNDGCSATGECTGSPFTCPGAGSGVCGGTIGTHASTVYSVSITKNAPFSANTICLTDMTFGSAKVDEKVRRASIKLSLDHGAWSTITMWLRTPSHQDILVHSND